MVLGHSAAVTLDEERTAASQHSGVAPSVVENIYYIDVVWRLYYYFYYHYYTDLSPKVFLAYSRRLAAREFSSIPSTKV